MFKELDAVKACGQEYTANSGLTCNPSNLSSLTLVDWTK